MIGYDFRFKRIALSPCRKEAEGGHQMLGSRWQRAQRALRWVLGLLCRQSPQDKDSPDGHGERAGKATPAFLSGAAGGGSVRGTRSL